MSTKPPPALDRLDHRLLAQLQADSGQTLEALGDAIGLSPSAVQRRIARYRADGLLLRQVAVLDPGRFDGIVLATVFVTLEQESTALHRAFRERMRAAPEVQQCYELAGSRDYLVILAATGMRTCRDILDRLFMTDANVKRFDTHFVFDAVKTGLALPTAGPSAGD
ncbi:MAG TPA: Lrp/AsnC family transcriptional regulator [Inquilinus sp.]|nr:Lrp/AsnC family transcriptional regulator [Inquilinus sp.]